MTSTTVALLDDSDRTLHRPKTGEAAHLMTACGIGPLGQATVGPEAALRTRATRLCPECFRRAYRDHPSEGVD